MSDRLGLLSAGANVLAIQALNRSASDPNFLILPELVVYRATTLTNAFFPTPTPGAFNVGSVSGFVTTPRFSGERGFYDAAFDLELTTVTAGATIVYTTNGTLPALTNGFVYQGPLWARRIHRGLAARLADSPHATLADAVGPDTRKAAA